MPAATILLGDRNTRQRGQRQSSTSTSVNHCITFTSTRKAPSAGNCQRSEKLLEHPAVASTQGHMVTFWYGSLFRQEAGCQKDKQSVHCLTIGSQVPWRISARAAGAWKGCRGRDLPRKRCEAVSSCSLKQKALDNRASIGNMDRTRAASFHQAVHRGASGMIQVSDLCHERPWDKNDWQSAGKGCTMEFMKRMDETTNEEFDRRTARSSSRKR